MKKKALALSVLAAISTQAGAFQLDTGEDWKIRWDNQLKGNVMSRLNKSQSKVVDAEKYSSARLADDSTYSVNRKSGGIASARIDLRSELDVIWKQNFGFRVSGAGWYDAAYEDNDNNSKGQLPNGQAYDYSWAGLDYKPGEYSDDAEDLHYAGGELLDAFVFGNWDIGDTALGIRAGQHTIFWGQSLLGTGAITGIAGSMTALDLSKAISVPGTEAQEIFLPSNKISTVFQATDNLTFNAYYEFDHRVNRLPETGSYWNMLEVLTENTQFLSLVPGSETSSRAGYKGRDDKMDDSGEFGFAVDYFIEALNLETQLVYINGSDRATTGVYGTSGGIAPEDFARYASPWADGGSNALVIGEFGWVYKNDVETFGLALSKQMFDISFGMDIAYRKNAGLNPEFTASLVGRGSDTPADYSADDYPGAVGDIWGVVVNGLGLLNGDMGIWDGGSWIVEYTTSWLDDYADNEAFANTRIHKGRVTSQIAGIFRPTWYQVFPGWDMTLPMTVSYGIDGEQAPQSSVVHEELGNASIGVSFLIDAAWTIDAKYSAYFGPSSNGTTGPLKDRDNISMTVKRTW